MESKTFSAPFILQREYGSDILLFGHDGVSVHLTNNDKLFSSLQLHEIQIIICVCLLWGKERIPLSESYSRIGTSNCICPHERFMMAEEHSKIFLVFLQFIFPLTDAGLVQKQNIKHVLILNSVSYCINLNWDPADIELMWHSLIKHKFLFF
jgi:hypothetical protein